ncbi:translation initiation factor IF-2 [Alcanivorax jadensis T9]|jgi:translation initiation factor IF-2|uniref:Translation initiation factor IF-2 n=1 Tax=Alcanivorax jadensis T9 TaxID=1177181 RepID=A0ABR4WBH9_9GAMM|nr:MULTISPECIES: translation initiation factor IF-2 [Alcanivorax]KGD60772.1 translation initiation factor IF-2 [Alcanivorax jadensis T9]MAC16415.1 translation initiation factor IF-2 [Alcanivorax sp.]MBG33580.1 translation initiation factor IF-2 [Alcanivorax sp.]MBP22767.1 translation initiation factor IF-2 [Alcanivorax sp.]MDF1637983.1 translation initiation factor IF-2 [Alcanivorax jadensis]|tara:strand:+ start:71817 stop:74507 length:2691 start_codon:yes stop_codon:yes gene_type:complete
MAETTVKKLADIVGTPVEKLLMQMKDAGLPHGDASEVVSDEQKQQLLAHLRKSHGAADTEAKKITLKRKSTSTIKTTGAAGKSKTVNVEVRKKRTYVKRETLEEQEREEAERKAAEEAARLAEEEQRQAEEVAKRQAEEAASKKEEDAKARAEAERKAAGEKAAEEKTKRVSVPKTAAAKKPAKAETAEEKAKREEAERKQREADEAKRKQEAETRKKAEEEAARRTAEEAARIAAELEKRGDQEEKKPEEEEDKGSSIVVAAQEASYQREERQSRRRRRKPKSAGVAHGQMKSSMNKQHGFKTPTEKKIYEVEVPETITVGDLAQRMNIKAKQLIKAMMKMGEMATVNQFIDQETAFLLVEEMGHKPVASKGQEEVLEDHLAGMVVNRDEGDLNDRAPVVTIMGHVDHGKTSLLDYIRKAKVADGEAGGITQHIGAYHVEHEKGMITFLDTPGHAAFTAMRARGAKATDIVVIVVAADDGVMPQTAEAIDHAKASGAPIIIAVNKIDKEQADPDRVRNELATKDVIPEEWGGEYQFINVSAHSGQGVDDLLDAILLQSELLELKAPSTGSATGVVIESRIEKGRGTVASILIQAGQLNIGDMLLAGAHFGRVRAMVDENGKPIKTAGPSIPVEVLGLDGAPEAGEQVQVVPDEKKAREVAEFRQERDRDLKLKRQQASKLENLFENMGSAETKTVNIVLKTDVRGSLEALTGALHDLGTDEVKVNLVSAGVGAINESDVNLAMTSEGVLLGFNVRADSKAKKLCEQEGLDLRYYSVIYELIDDVKSAMSGLLAPEKREEILGTAQVRDVFRSSKFGAVAGCMVIEGTLYRNRPIRVLRDDVVVFEGELESLRRFKDDVQEVRNGMECGIAVKSYNDVKAGDKIEVFEVKEVARFL